jgi:hypothetical protein
MLTTAQLQTLKTAIAAETDPTFVGYRTNGDNSQMAAWYNGASTFVVYKSSIPMPDVGKVLNYDAVGALTSANTARIQTFEQLNQVSFKPSADVRSFWDATFSGALAGQGQATRDTLVALWKRFATRCEKLYATGTGSDASPGALVFEGAIAWTDITDARNLP